MALSVARGVITEPGSTGNLAVTGTGFQPKVVLFYGARLQTATGNSIGAYMMQGAAVSSTERMVTHNHGQDATNAAGGGNWITRCINITPYASATAATVADFVSMDSDGFTVNFSAVSGGGELIEWVALGGTDVANVKILQDNTPTATGNDALTGAGFQPNFGLRFGGRGATTTGSDTQSTTLTGGPLRMAAVVSTSSRWVQFNDIRSAGEAGVLDPTKVEIIYISGSLTERADFVSWDADGVTTNFDTASVTSKFSYWVLFNLTCDFDIGVADQSTSTAPVTTSVSGLGQTPALLMLASSNVVASTTVSTTTAKTSRGWATSTSSRGAMSSHSDNAATDIRGKRYSQDKIIDMITATAGGGTITVDASADLSSFDSGGFTLNWTTTDATAREYAYVAIGNAVTSSINSNFFAFM